LCVFVVAGSYFHRVLSLTVYASGFILEHCFIVFSDFLLFSRWMRRVQVRPLTSSCLLRFDVRLVLCYCLPWSVWCSALRNDSESSAESERLGFWYIFGGFVV
jgi:hypothetical protein